MRKKQKSLIAIPFLVVYFFCLSGLRAQNLFFEKISGQEIDPSTSIHGIAKDAVGYIWFGSWNGVYRYDGKTFDYYRHNLNNKNSLPNNRIRNIISDKLLGLWFLTFDKKYAKYNYQLNNFEVVADKAVPKTIIAKLNSTANTLNADKIVDGRHYYLSSNFFTALDLKTKKEFRYTANINQPGSLLDDYITTFFIDDKNSIWLGTRGGDIYKANPNRNPFELHYSYITKAESTKLATVRAILKVENQIWIGTDEGMLIYDKDKINWQHPFYQSNTQIKQVRTLLRDKNGFIWIGGVNGLECYDAKTNLTRGIINKKLCPNLTTWSVFAIENGSKNNLWIGLYNGIARVDLSSHSTTFFDLTQKIKNRSVMDILCVDQHSLWLGTEGNGLIRLKVSDALGITTDETSTFAKSELNKRVSASMVYALQKDKRGFVWLGTSEGLYKINSQKNPMSIENVPLHLEAANTYISSITDDNFGNLWVAHKEGISRIAIRSGEIANYQNKDKLGSWRFLERAFYKDTLQNKIYFGSKNGYLTFNPDKIKTISNEDTLVFKSLYVSNQEVIPMDTIWGKPILTQTLSQTKTIELEYENRSFAIEFASFNYYDTQKQVFEYILEGYDDNWIKTTSNRMSFSNVPSGKYTLKLRLVTPNANSMPTTQLQVVLKALWYQTWWAKMVLIIGIAMLLYWVFIQILYRERLKNEIKLERLNTERQEALNKEKIEFFTNISHDLKTPLSLIVDPLKQLQDEKVAPEDKEIYFSIVNRNINYLTKLIYQILDFRKSEMGKLKLNPTIQEINAFVTSCFNSFQFISDKRNIALQLHIPDEKWSGSLDFEKVEQIITNLLSNSFKYTPDGGKITVRLTHNKPKSTIEISIEDNGIGIEASELEKIFEPFNNLGSAPFYGYSSGIGLSLTRNLVQLMNGTITIESAPQKGTKASILFPYSAATSNEILGELKEEFIFPKNQLAKKNENLSFENTKPVLLVVEDNPDVQLYLSKELGKEYQILQEYDGKKGLESAIKNIPDLIISDVMMPEMQGTDLCKELKANPNTCHIPVILLTAKDSDANQIEGYELGAEAYVMKPFKIAILNAQIKSVLENRILLQSRLSGIKKINQLQEEVSTQDNYFLEKIIEIIQNAIEDVNFNAEELAQLLGISQRQLYRKLKGITGSTVHEFIIKVKMNQAEELLKNSNLNIAQIAYKVGFSEPSNFSRTFSKHFGCSPSQYLSQIQR